MSTVEEFWRSIQKNRRDEITHAENLACNEARRSAAKRAIIAEAGITEGQAKMVMSAIAGGRIPYVVLEP